MYSPTYNRVEDRAELLAFMRANSFAVLVTGTGGTLHASHLPVMIREAKGHFVLDMHMAKNNPQWQEFFDDEVMVVFAGPHAYVSPRWYEEAERVPTWNYAAVHAYGTPKIIDDFEIEVARLETRWKLSQNRSRREMELIAAALDASGDSAERALAALTRRHLVGE
jgi:transcriptional regulator